MPEGMLNLLQAVVRHRNEILGAVQGAHMVFLTAGMGCGIGTGATPAIAALAREAGALVVSL